MDHYQMEQPQIIGGIFIRYNMKKPQRLVKLIRRNNKILAEVEKDYELKEGEVYTDCSYMIDIDQPLEEWKVT